MNTFQTCVLTPIPVADACTLALAISNTAMFLVLDSLNPVSWAGFIRANGTDKS